MRIPKSTHSFLSLLPTVRIRPLELFSVSSVNLCGTYDFSIFCNNPCVRLSPIKSLVLRKYPNSFKRSSLYHSITKCNVKSCNCCEHLCTNTTITSSVNGRAFSVFNDSDLD